jgi:Ca-activated chloride channel homolog
MRKAIAFIACLVSVYATAQFSSGAAQPMEIAATNLCGPLAPCSTTLSSLASATPRFTLRHDVSEVRLQFSVTDKLGRHISSLSKNDIALSDNGVAVSELTDFREESDLPIEVVILIDSSRSTERELPMEKQLALEFLHHLLRPQDRAMVAGFGTHLEMHGTFTGHFDELESSVQSIKAAGLTAFNDSLFTLSRNFESSSTARRVIVIISDGNDTVSAHTFNDAREALLKKDVAIYTISVTDKKSMAPAACLEQLSGETGGHSYFLKDLRKLKQAFAQIDSDLRTYYVAAYRSPDHREGFHSVDVQLAAHDLHVQSKKGYFRQE